MSELDRLYAQKKQYEKYAKRLKIVSFAIVAAVIAIIFFTTSNGRYNLYNLIILCIPVFMIGMPLLVRLLGKSIPNRYENIQNLTPRTKISSQNLNELEDQRQKLIKFITRIKFISFAVAIPVGAGLYFLTELIPAVYIAAIAYYAFFSFMTSSKKAEFSTNFKTRIIGAIVKDRGLEYDADGSLDLDDFFKIYDCRVDEWNGEDLISGKIDDVNVKFSDFYAAKRIKTKNGTRTVTLFRGTLFVADFHKNVNAVVFVTHKNSKNLAAYGSAAKMDDVRFEEYFDVYASDQIAARYALTPVLMSRLLEISLRINASINLLFEGGKIYIAIETWRDRFEANLDTPITQNMDIVGYESDVDELASIVRELNLNRKIWGE